jgi:ABC-type nitrate/sulfonate/bicarbonate transport system permease component
MQADQLMAGLVVLSLLGLYVGSGLSMIERAFLTWR